MISHHDAAFIGLVVPSACIFPNVEYDLYVLAFGGNLHVKRDDIGLNVLYRVTGRPEARRSVLTYLTVSASLSSNPVCDIIRPPKILIWLGDNITAFHNLVSDSSGSPGFVDEQAYASLGFRAACFHEVRRVRRAAVAAVVEANDDVEHEWRHRNRRSVCWRWVEWQRRLCRHWEHGLVKLHDA